MANKNNIPEHIIEAARVDWQEQCKKFLQGISFRDKSAKECLERHIKLAERRKGQCFECSSYAINPHMYGREPNTDLHLCDVCYWRKRAKP